MGLLRKLAYATAATTATAGGCLAVERTPSAVDPDAPGGGAASAVIAAVRFTRSLKAAAFIMADYRLLFARHREYESAEYKAERSLVHRRSADRLLALARQQGAVYVKIGQHIASMNHAVPPEYSDRLRLLEDRAAYRPFWQVRRAVDRQLGAGRALNDVFEEFGHVPVAAASLAQVHRATLRETGQPVAVKVQYPGLNALVQGDLTSIQFLARLLRFVFPFFDMDWVVDQFRVNLAKELDFELEARSAQRAAALFRDDRRVIVPDVHTALSTKRLLVMDFIEGCRVDDLDTLRAAGVDTHAVAQTVVDAFAQMIFINGFVHCDPHAGNLLVRYAPDGSGKFELCLLDHGLYRELEDPFRQSYCRLWKGLVLRRSGDVEQACDELGATGLANLFSVFLLNRSWRTAKRLGTDIRVKMSKEELLGLRQDMRDSGLKSQADVSEFVQRVPDDLFLVFKMNSLVRNVNRALGASVNRFKVNARFAVRGVRHKNLGKGRSSKALENEDGKAGTIILAGTHVDEGVTGMLERIEGVATWLATAMDCVVVELQFAALDVVMIVLRWWLGGNSSHSDRAALAEADAQGGSAGVVDSRSLIG